MTFHSKFYFHGRLNDFLPKRRKLNWIHYQYKMASSVKDAIEAIGVPHVEIERIKVNEVRRDFHYLIKPDDKVEVFPFENNLPEDAPKSFVLDVHLGKLARLLRMLGIDTAYQNNYTDQEIVDIAVKENRAVLTRDVGLLKHKILNYGYWLRSQKAEEQLTEVIKHFSLCNMFYPLSRCISCNGMLLQILKSEIIHTLPSQIRTLFDEFYQCSNCNKVYWKGSHYENMQRVIAKVKSIVC